MYGLGCHERDCLFLLYVSLLNCTVVILTTIWVTFGSGLTFWLTMSTGCGLCILWLEQFQIIRWRLLQLWEMQELPSQQLHNASGRCSFFYWRSTQGVIYHLHLATNCNIKGVNSNREWLSKIGQYQYWFNHDFMFRNASWVDLVQESCFPFFEQIWQHSWQRCKMWNVLPVVPGMGQKWLQLFTISWL